MNVGRCRPQMWGLRWGYLRRLSGKRKPCLKRVATLVGQDQGEGDEVARSNLVRWLVEPLLDDS
jgi:hypothetical protein